MRRDWESEDLIEVWALLEDDMPPEGDGPLGRI